MNIGLNDLLKTMAKVAATDLALIPRAVPVMRVAETWRPLDVPALSIAAVRMYADQLLDLVAEKDRLDGTPCDFVHKHGRFRVRACGYPETSAVLVIRLSNEAGSQDA